MLDLFFVCDFDAIFVVLCLLFVMLLGERVYRLLTVSFREVFITTFLGCMDVQLAPLIAKAVKVVPYFGTLVSQNRFVKFTVVLHVKRFSYSVAHA